MPHGSTVYAYGRLSGEPIGKISVADLIFEKKSINGYFITRSLVSGSQSGSRIKI